MQSSENSISLNAVFEATAEAFGFSVGPRRMEAFWRLPAHLQAALEAELLAEAADQSRQANGAGEKEVSPTTGAAP
jgi:hypothetical protein